MDQTVMGEQRQWNTGAAPLSEEHARAAAAVNGIATFGVSGATPSVPWRRNLSNIPPAGAQTAPFRDYPASTQVSANTSVASSEGACASGPVTGGNEATGAGSVGFAAEFAGFGHDSAPHVDDRNAGWRCFLRMTFRASGRHRPGGDATRGRG